MTVAELMEALEDFDPNAEVFLAIQPRWPFEYSMDDAVVGVDGKVYLAEGQQVRYLPKEVSDELGW